MSFKIYIDGKLYAKEDAKISVYDHGLLYGDGVFDSSPRPCFGHIRGPESARRLPFQHSPTFATNSHNGVTKKRINA